MTLNADTISHFNCVDDETVNDFCMTNVLVAICCFLCLSNGKVCYYIHYLVFTPRQILYFMYVLFLIFVTLYRHLKQSYEILWHISSTEINNKRVIFVFFVCNNQITKQKNKTKKHRWLHSRSETSGEILNEVL